MSERTVSIEWWCQGGYNGKPEATDVGIFPYMELHFGSGANYDGDNYRCVRLWEQSAEHSKLVPVLQLMGPVWQDAICHISLTEDEVFSLLGWTRATIPTTPSPHVGIAEIGPVWDWKYGRSAKGRDCVVLKEGVTWAEVRGASV